MHKQSKNTLIRPQLYITFLLVLSFCAPPERGKAQNIDLDILKSINPRYPDSQYWIQTSGSAYWVPAAACVGMLAYGLIKNDFGAKAKAYELLISVGSAIAVTELLKPIVHRARPADAYPDEIFTSSATHGGSFPSGHTTLAFSTAATIAMEYKKWYITVPAYLWAGSVGYSRMYLGKHYPTDVLAGAAIGIGGAYFGRWLSKKLFHEKRQLKMQ
jgi:membrane-associated phospholipid phosphatase